jgi:hypothetical protein
VGVVLGVGVGVGVGIGDKQGSAQQGRYGGMHIHVPQQQSHSVPTGHSDDDGLHSLTVGSGVGVAVVASADERTASISASTRMDDVRTGITTCACYSNGSMVEQHHLARARAQGTSVFSVPTLADVLASWLQPAGAELRR